MLGCVLLANLLVLAWLLLRKPAQAPAVVAASAAVGANPAPPAIAAAPVPEAGPNAEPSSIIAATEPQPAAGAATIAAPVTMVAEEPSSMDELPTMQELLASGVTLPALLLNLHVYDQAPGNRFVMLNSRRLREGDELPEGIRVERITPDGVVLVARGRRFLLVAGG